MKKNANISRVVITLCIFIGTLVLVFPTAANWFSTVGYHEEYNAYVEQVGQLSEEEIDQIIDSAREYNRRLPNGPLRDPYLLNAAGEVENLNDGLEDYYSQLNVGDNQPMAIVHVPSVGIHLPVRHGTSDATLEKSAGHLHGSGLPVGGTSTHAVITAHSGRVESKLFSDLHKVKVNDTFYVEVLGRKFYYRVEEIVKIEPESGDKLRQVPGKDYVTLVTCTPIGINSHRLLVRGVRIDAPENSEDDNASIRSGGFSWNFPWWAVVLIGVPSSMYAYLYWSDKRKGVVGTGTRSHSGRRAPRQHVRAP